MKYADAPTRRAAANLLVRHAVAFAVNFVGTLVLARNLGPSLWGTYTIGYTVQTIGAALLERSAVGVLVQRRLAPSSREYGTILSVELGGGIVLSALLLISASVLRLEGAAALILISVSLSLPAYAARAVPLGMLERTMSYRRVAAVEIADALAFNLVAVVGIAAGFGFAAVAFGSVARVIPSVVLAWRLSGLQPRFAASITAFRELVRFGLPYTLSNSLGWVNSAAAPVVVGGIAGVQALGLLQLAYTLIGYPQVLIGVVARIALPVYSRLESNAPELATQVDRATASAIRFVGGTTLALAAVLPLIIPIVYGAAWDGLGPIALAIAPAIGIASSYVFVIAGLNAAGNASRVLVISVVFTAFYWAAAGLLVYAFGAMGLPLAYSAVSFVQLAYLLTFRARIGQLRLRGALTRFFYQTVMLSGAALAVNAGQPELAAAAGALIFLTTIGTAPLSIVFRAGRRSRVARP